jgi:hypothetical protein
MSQTKSTSGFVLESAVINSTRQLEPIDVLGLVTDVEIFEHMDLPYITGQVAIVDTFRLYDRLDFQGAEYFIIKIKQSENSPIIEKRFVIDKLMSNKKTNEQSDLIMFHIVEDTLFNSNLLNVNKMYKGNPFEIITSIANEWLDKAVNFINEEVFQKKIKVIIPNLTPFDAMTWIKNRATTTNGFPVYLFSSFTVDDIICADLKTLIDGQPINKSAPLIYGATNHDIEANLQYRLVPIKEYSIGQTDDLYNLIADGLVGAEHQFIDTHYGENKKYKFNVDKDSFINILEDNVSNKRVTFANDFEFNEKPIQEYTSRKILKITQSGAYDDGTNRYRSYAEDIHASDHAKKIIAHSLKKFLLKAPITVRIDGAGFIQDESHYTTGNIIRILFTANRPTGDGTIKLDLKKSGDYLIYGAKHSFGHTRYNIHLKCVKLTSYTDDNPMKVIG